MCRAASNMGARGRLFSRHVVQRTAANSERHMVSVAKRVLQRHFPGGTVCQVYPIRFPLACEVDPDKVVFEEIGVVLPWDVICALYILRMRYVGQSMLGRVQTSDVCQNDIAALRDRDVRAARPGWARSRPGWARHNVALH